MEPMGTPKALTRRSYVREGHVSAQEQLKKAQKEAHAAKEERCRFGIPDLWRRSWGSGSEGVGFSRV